MNSKIMNVHEALCELKMVSKQLENDIPRTTYARTVKHSVKKIDGMTLEAFQGSIKSSYQSICDKIKYYEALKEAITISNATTFVVIGQKTMTIAEAIAAKKYAIPIKEKLLENMQRDYDIATDTLSTENEYNLEPKADEYIKSIIAAQPQEAKVTINSEAMVKLREEYIAKNTYDFIDPLRLKSEIESLSQEIDAFHARIDTVISTSNATTEITVTW